MKGTERQAGTWLVWVSVALTAAYCAVHVGMLLRSFYAWGGILHALVFAR